ncbi:MAG: hypothetical protein QNJ18_24630 [Xenococcaceae cyanobacterium MO_167.B52]|nr:hypothetical protein [Xenococcaceae cyanobacterium MO_167.B52]
MRQILFNSAFNSAKSEDEVLDTSPDSSVVEPQPNFKKPELETVELVNNYEYFQRFEILWDDLAEWL